MNIFNWIETELNTKTCDSDKLFYNDMESQSGKCLPIIYKPFDINNHFHWLDRGAILDFLTTTRCRNGSVLDFGPGDGWPSLLLAQYAKKVIGVEGSLKRVEICTNNAAKLGIKNANFIHVENGMKLPFKDESFDAATAASSIEQSRDPKETAKELCRVLKPGARLRTCFETLDVYSNGKENDYWITRTLDGKAKIILYDRRISEERAIHYAIFIDISEKVFKNRVTKEEGIPEFEDIAEILPEFKDMICRSLKCELYHPSVSSMTELLKQAGFSDVNVTYCGSRFAQILFTKIPTDQRPADRNELDRFLQPIIETVTQLPAPPIITDGHYAWVTAVK